MNRGRDASRVAVADSLLHLLRRYWRPVLAAIMAGAFVGYLAATLQATRYEAEARLFLDEVALFDPLGTSANPDAPRFVANQVAIIGSDTVLGAAAQRLRGTALPVLRAAVDLSGSGEEDLLIVRAGGPTPEAAQARANAVAASYADYRTTQVARQTEDALAQSPDPERRSEVRARAAAYGSGIALVEEAVAPVEPTQPKPLRSAFLLAMVAGFLATLLVLLRAARGDEVSIRKAAVLSNVAVLGPVPRWVPGRPVPVSSRTAEAYRLVLLTLRHLSPDCRRVLLTSSRDDGATGVTLNLALAAAGQGLRVLLVDGHGPEGPLTKALRPSFEQPMSAPALLATSQPAMQPCLVDSVHLRLLTLPDPSLYPDGRLDEVLGGWASGYDLVLAAVRSIDSSADGLALAQTADLNLLVADVAASGETLYRVRDRLALVGKPLAGVLIASSNRRHLGPREGRSRGGGGRPLPPGRAGGGSSAREDEGRAEPVRAGTER